MRIPISILLIISCLSGQGQALVGNQQPIQVKVASYGATQNALISLPDDYNTTTGNYPLIIFLHGYGEIGSTMTDLNKEIKQGLPLVISRGMKIQATNPIDGKLYKFIVLSPQHFGWTTPPENIAYMLQSLPKEYRIDTTRIYITGLSAGGQGVIMSVTYSQALTNKIAAIVPMSPSAPDDATLKKFTFFSQSKTGAWFFSGKSDPGNFTDNARRYNDSINKYNPGGSKLTLYPGTHCCWPIYYDPSFRENGMNIYEWMLTFKRGQEPVIPEPPKVTKICIDSANLFKKVIILMKDGTFKELNGLN